MKKVKITKINPKLCAIVLAGTIFITTMSGCHAPGTIKELSSSSTDYDTINTNLDSENSDGITKGVKQVLPVDGEEFNLVIEYSCDDAAWCINSDKKLHMRIYTQGLPDDINVYVDDIHMDTVIRSSEAKFDGLKQDTLDDGPHSSLILGFPISDNKDYYGINIIEGQNSEFLEGYINGYNSIYGGEVEGEISTQRFTEADFLEEGVWGNKISGTIGLAIQDKDTGEIIRYVDVKTDLQIEANNEITYEIDGEKVIYRYDKNGNRERVTAMTKGKKLVK